MASHILIVDDEPEITDLISLYLSNEGYVVHPFYTAQDALAYLAEHPVDLGILDVMLPDMDGFALCRQIRMEHLFPLIMLTAKGSEVDKITGLTLGADDYMTKPFKPLELVARVKAQLRRVTRYSAAERETAPGDEIAVRGLVLNRTQHTCLLDERPIDLTPTEFGILWTLCEHLNTAVSSEAMFEQVWGEKYYTNANNTVMVHIRHLREKMGETVGKPKHIKTVWGVGYKIEA